MNSSLDLTHANGLAFLSPAIEALGWTLVHFIWQGTAIAVAVACLLATMRSASPRSRYAAGCVGLSLMFLAAGATLGWQIAARDVGAKREQRAVRIVAFSPPVATKTPLVDIRAGRQAVPVESLSTPREALPLIRRLPEIATPIEPTAIPVEVFRASPWIGKSLAEPLRAVLPWLVGVWACGVGFCSLRLWAGWRVIRRLRVQGQEPNDSVWNARFDRLRRRIGCSTSVRLLWSASATVPMVIGWVRPVVLVPAGLLTGLSVAQLEALLAHELAHIRRHDFLVNLLQNVLETLVFYHPAVWWVSQQVRSEREHCCDDLAADICGGPLDYARALAALAEVRHASALLGLAATGGSLVARIARLAGLRSPAPRVGWPLTALVLLGGAFAAFLAANRSGLSDDSRVRRVADSNGALSDRVIARSNASKSSKLIGTEVVANVNGEPILASEVFERAYFIPLEPYQMSLMDAAKELKAGRLREDEYRQLQEVAIRTVLKELIRTRLLAQASLKNLDKEQTRQAEAAVSKMFEEYAGKLKQEFPLLSQQQLAAKLQGQGWSLDRLRQEFRRRLLADEYVRSKQHTRPINRDTLEAYYRNHLNEYSLPEKVRWQVVEISFERHGGRQTALTVAQNAKAELRRGENFASVVRKYSDGLRREQGGESWWAMLGTPDDQEQNTAIRQIAVGDIEPVFDEQWENNIFAERIVSSNAPDKKTQASETSAGALVVQRVQLDCTLSHSRRIRLHSRYANEFKMVNRPVPNGMPGEHVTIITGGATLFLEGLDQRNGGKRAGTIDLSADRMVIWSHGELDDAVNRKGGIVQSAEEPFDVYLEGNVVIFQKDPNNPKLMRQVQAVAATFDALKKKPLVLEAKLEAYLSSTKGSGRVWADRLRQLGPNPFSGKDFSTIRTLSGKASDRVRRSGAGSAPGFSLEKIGADVVIQAPARGAENLRPSEAADRDARTSFDADGGTQSWTNPANVADPRLSAVLQQLAPGETSAVLETADAFHIVRVVDRRPAACKPFDEVEPSIRRKLEQQLQEKIVEGLYRKATIESAYLPDRVPKRGARERG